MKNGAVLDSKRGIVTLTLGLEETARLRLLASSAQRFFAGLDPKEWNSPDDVHALQRLKAGARVLESLALSPVQHKMLRLADAGLAFFALHAYSAAAALMPRHERQSATEMILLFSNTRTIRFALDVLPAEPDIPLALAVDETVSKHLIAMLKAQAGKEKCYELGLGDGLFLYEALETNPCQCLRELYSTLEKATMGLRAALEDLRG